MSSRFCPPFLAGRIKGCKKNAARLSFDTSQKLDLQHGRQRFYRVVIR